ncbi:hypothetical protein D9757_002984 [Collybiopsis confluens]|uniref:Uncharacterized protein n=1 Tax=Collybiopsis confluens TaxID=2823264 RepID=A0A8H5HVS7_9AGAR|nr:hypothetical protein D9757_002984 [Collybiopsis confluens]
MSESRLAYTKLALNTMGQIVKDAQQMILRSEHHAPSQEIPVLRVALHHRIGTVVPGVSPDPYRLTSVDLVIAVSSPHRKEAFHACEFILEEVKRRAQIWKREYYEGENENEAEWKSNAWWALSFTLLLPSNRRPR